jgi:hypothetical protein
LAEPIRLPAISGEKVHSPLGNQNLENTVQECRPPPVLTPNQVSAIFVPKTVKSGTDGTQ